MKEKPRKARMPDKLSVHSGVLLAHFLGEDLGEVVRSHILPPRNRSVYCSRLAISELFYMLCRRKGEQLARELTSTLLKTNYVSVLSSDDLDMEAGHYKCSRAISLADCYVLSVAKMMSAAAVFAKREEDLRKEIGRHPFDVKLLFLEDFRELGLPKVDPRQQITR